MIKRSKTKNLEVYFHLLKFKTFHEAYKKAGEIAEHFNITKNKVISIISQARRNPKIFSELKYYDIRDSKIPDWFIHPQKEEDKNNIKDPVEELQPSSNAPKEIPRNTNQTNEQKSFPKKYSIPVINYSEIEQAQRGAQTYLDQQLNKKIDLFQQGQSEQRRRDEKRDQEFRLDQTEDPNEILRIYREDPEWEKMWCTFTPSQKSNIYQLIKLLCQRKREKRVADEKNDETIQALQVWALGRYMEKW